MRCFVSIVWISVLFAACKPGAKQTSKLPILGEAVVNGNDTSYPIIEDFKFINQDSVLVTHLTFKDKVYVADFIFLNCPSICPKMNLHMLDVYHQFENNPNVLFLSHTIDPENDSIHKLKVYSDNLGVISSKWHFVTGNQDSIYKVSEQSYFSSAYSDSTAPGGLVHSGGLFLIDRQRHIRGVYDGTDSLEKNRLIKDIQILLSEQF